MNVTLDYLTGNRKWLVRDYVVWGDAGIPHFDILLTELNSTQNRVAFMRELPAADGQIVEFADLLDHRGNRLPSTINHAQVIIIPKNAVLSFIVGEIGPSSFRLAKTSGQPRNAIVDLLIMEMN